jgi:hypothetical protein
VGGFEYISFFHYKIKKHSFARMYLPIIRFAQNHPINTAVLHTFNEDGMGFNEDGMGFNEDGMELNGMPMSMQSRGHVSTVPRTS